MYLDKVVVSGLFGLFDYEIELCRSGPVTVIHGPNGYGKTAILKLIDALFNGPTKTLHSTLFSAFTVYFTSGEEVRVVQQQGENGTALVYTHRGPDGKEREGAEQLISSCRVELIGTDRLLAESPQRGERRFAEVLGHYAHRLADRIGAAMAEYVKLSESLDRTFADRVASGAALRSAPAGESEWHRWASRLETMRNRLVALGIVDPKEGHAMPPQVQDAAVRPVLALHLHHIEQKLAVFQTLATRTELFLAIINRNFRFKRMILDRERGFYFETVKGVRLDPDELSSGEQHQIVLFYRLLFEIPERALILIDEPELSLHVAWQLRFIPDLLRVIELHPFRAVVATHSPQIINDRWDLTIGLEGEKDA